METTEMTKEVELRRLRWLVRRLDYVRSHMAAGDAALLDHLTGRKCASDEYLATIDQAIDLPAFPTDTAISAVLAMQALIDKCRDGSFYEDHDESLDILAAAELGLEALR